MRARLGKDTEATCQKCKSWLGYGTPSSITTDFMGPISPAALRNSSYIFAFIDVYSRFSVVYYLKNKSSSSVLDSLIIFERDLGRPFGRRVQYLRSDQGNEYTNRNFREYCKRTGVIQQFTAPYTPQQDGISEDSNGHDKVFLTEEGLPKRLWVELASMAVFLKNRIPRNALGGCDIPYF